MSKDVAIVSHSWHGGSYQHQVLYPNMYCCIESDHYIKHDHSHVLSHINMHIEQYYKLKCNQMFAFILTLVAIYYYCIPLLICIYDVYTTSNIIQISHAAPTINHGLSPSTCRNVPPTTAPFY